MAKELNMISSAASGCGTCGSTGCATCSPAPKKDGPAALSRHELDTCIAAMAMTAKDMNPQYKETSEAGLASLVLC